MNSKIPVSRLSEVTAARVGCTQAEATQFIKDLFAIVEAEVTAGGEPEIKGLGKFAKSNIPGEPLEFIPDEDFAALLNEDFASFEPVKLNEGVTDEMLAEAEIAEPGHDDHQNTTSEPKAMEEPVQETADTDNSGPATQAADTEPDQTESKPESATEYLSETPPELPDTAVEQNQPVQCQTESAPEGDAATPTPQSEAKASDEPLEAPQQAADGQETPIAKVEQQDEDDDTEPQCNPIEEEDVEYVIVRRPKSRFWVGLAIGLILGFALGVIAYIWYLIQYLQLPVEDITGL